ncbi:SPOSA6832_00637, partial [Sporobolomyces salmonicolor]
MATTAHPTTRATTPTGATVPVSSPSPPHARPFSHAHSHSSGLSASAHAGVSGSASARIGSNTDSKFRASVEGGPRWGPGPAQGNAGGAARAVSPGRASTGGAGNLHGLRPNTVTDAALALAIDRWFEDLQHYEATLEEMAAASLDANFKEELSAIEQWFRVLSEAERTAALYSLLQSATQVQMRFFITVLQQMARQDPMQAALLSPANPSQLSLEAQMEAKLASLGLKSPASPAIRQFARQSLGASANASLPTANNDSFLSPNPNLAHTAAEDSIAASTLAAQRAKLKASARTSAPANLLLGASHGASAGEGLKSPLWSKEETLRERSPSPRPKSTGSTGEPHTNGSSHAGQHHSQSAQPPASASFLRSPGLDASFGSEAQLSPLVGGSWASMVNTPLVPMFGKAGETMEPGNYGASPNPNGLGDSLGQRLGNWHDGGATSPNSNGGIVLDDVRKFRRSARISGGALSGMYEEPTAHSNGNNHSSGSSNPNAANSAATAQKRVQDQLQAVQQLKNMQQSAINLGLGSMPSPLNGSNGASGGGSRIGSSGALNSPGLQQVAMAAQQNWRNANAPNVSPSSFSNSQSSSHGGNGVGQHQHDQFAGVGLGTNFQMTNALGSPSAQQQAQQQLANLIALQQQMMQQQQQLQNLAAAGGMNGLGMGMGMGGMMGNLSPAMGGMGMGMLGGQLSPRLGGNGAAGFGGMGLGMGSIGGIPSPRRSPRPHDRSPASFPMTSHRSANGSSSSTQLPAGSGSNPDEPLDFTLLGDTPAWLRSLRLHKYTPNFEGVSWREMVVLGDEDLEKKGVSALGARRKLLKVFETVRAKTGISSPVVDGARTTTSPPTQGTSSQDEKEDDDDKE